MTTFHHKWPGKDEISHLSITESSAHIEIRHFPFKAVHKTSNESRIRHFPRPVAKITGAN
jgi:hypothetical protein